jgi:cytochrome c553
LRGFILVLLGALLAATRAQAGTFDERKPQCLACHGEKGVSTTPDTPSLGGMPEDYLLYQLVFFREGTRVVPIMNEMMRGMSDDDLRAAGTFLAGLPPPPPDQPGDPERMARGKALADRNRCGFCHNPDYSGHDQIPRLADQREDYLLKALRDYKSEKRIGGGAMMSEVLHSLNDGDLVTLASYLAHIR